MRPGSLSGRLLLVGLAGILLASLVGAWLLGEAFQRASEQVLDRILVQEHAGLVGRLEAAADGSVALRDRPGDPDYERVFSGRYWQVGTGTSALTSRSLWDFEPELPALPSDGRLQRLETEGPSGQLLRLVRQQVRLPGADRPVLVWVAMDENPTLVAVADFRRLAGLAIGLLSTLFAAALVVQIRVGLRPLRGLATALGEVRQGQRARLDQEPLPSEIRPLVEHLNQLLEHHERSVTRARHTAADLAHALKTPLAALDAAAQAGGPDLPAQVRSQAARMHAAVQRQLAASLTPDFRARTPVLAVVEALGDLLGRVHAGRALAISWSVDAELCFRGSRDDLEELLGNLMDNACKWARTRVEISAAIDGGELALAVDDDGPGMSSAAAGQAVHRGVRLDEHTPGSGLGLSIVSELAKAYGGRLALGPSSLGGLRASLCFPLDPT